MEKMIERGRLYDFYGELLTPHQKKIYEAAVYDDLSLAEIAEEEGISRQGVHDIIKRVSATLEDYEDKLHMAERFDRITARANELKAAADRIEEDGDEKDRRVFLEELNKIAESILQDMI